MMVAESQRVFTSNGRTGARGGRATNRHADDDREDFVLVRHQRRGFGRAIGVFSACSRQRRGGVKHMVVLAASFASHPNICGCETAGTTRDTWLWWRTHTTLPLPLPILSSLENGVFHPNSRLYCVVVERFHRFVGGRWMQGAVWVRFAADLRRRSPRSASLRPHYPLPPRTHRASSSGMSQLCEWRFCQHFANRGLSVREIY